MSGFFNNKGRMVSPRSKKHIEQAANSFREMLGLKSPYIALLKVLDALSLSNTLDYQVLTAEEMKQLTQSKNTPAVSYPKKRLICMTEDTYDTALNHVSHGRFTIAHEIAHVMMHQNEVAYARTEDSNHKIYEDSEWQANTFASYLLMPELFINPEDTINDLVTRFKVSPKAAEIRLKKIKQSL